MSKLKVKAFTIIELIITMLISAIVIGIVYTSYRIVSRYYTTFNKKNANLAIVLRLDEWLNKDFDRAQMITKDSSGIALEYSKATIVKYRFEPDYVIRIGTIVDTFKIKTDAVNLIYEDGTPMNTATEQNVVNGLALPVFVQDEKITYHYNKIYSSVNLFNRNSNAIN